MELSCFAPCPLQNQFRVTLRTQTAIDWPTRVLLVEDNVEAAWLVQSSLEWTGEDRFHIEWARDLKEAVNRLADPGIEVILLDLGLPELNGYRSFLAVEVAAGRRIPVVILTSDDSDDSRDRVLRCGASDYLLKGRITPVQLRQTLRDAIRIGRFWGSEKTRR